MLLGLGGVRDVFLGGGLAHDRTGVAVDDGGSSMWIAVTRDDGTSWEALEPQVHAVLGDWPRTVDLSSPSSGSTAEPKEHEERPASSTPHAKDSIEAQIIEVLDERVRPGVQADGGDVQLVRWDAESGEVTLRLEGACQGCPHSAATLQDNIKRALTYFVPEVRSVTAEMAIDESNDSPTADIAWDHDAEPAANVIQDCAKKGTPFFSTFAGMKVEGPKLRRVKFMSRLTLNGRQPEHVFVTCRSCNAKRTIEDPNDLLLESKGNTTGDAAVVICPACCVLIER